MHGAINSTFIALIPKSDNPLTLNDFRPISLCNYIYKITSKIIANCLRPILSTHIFLEQFSFLQDRQIYEAIGTAQEVLHSIQINKIKGIILKANLSKAFDRVSWLYIRMLLTHLEFPMVFIDWIMCCITNISFSVLINGTTSPFFHSKRGLRKGFPLSPLLFLLVMEGLSRLIKDMHLRGRLTGIRITDRCTITHLLFVDDVLIFLNGGIGDLTAIQHSINLFQNSIGMAINNSNSTLTISNFSPHEIQFALQRFLFTLLQLEEGLQYLGYKLKPLGYKIVYWTWLISKLQRRLNIWYHKYLSRARRLVLIKAVLEATPVYWMSLAWIPRGILTRLQNICCRFLWKGKQTRRIFSWEKLDLLSIPKKWGGQGIKKLEGFSTALVAKLGWILITSSNLWTKVASSKYINPLRPMGWLRQTSWNKTGISNIWKAVLKSLSLI